MNEIADNQRTRVPRSGMRDLLPDEMARVRRVKDRFAAACRSWGYSEIRTPVIEPLHLFTAAGTLSPQALDRVYSFLDWDGWSGERVVLRPDSTIPAARLYAEHLVAGSVAKLFYSQNVFRFTDDGSDREETQCGVELIGDTGSLGDVEVVLMALDALSRIDLPDLTLQLSHAGIVRAILAAAGMSQEEQAAAYDRLLDGDATVVDEVEARLPQLNAPLRMLFDVEGRGTAYITNLRGPLVTAIPALAGPLDELEYVVGALEASGTIPVIKAVLARSFEYYSGIVLRIESGGQRVAAGGRYDDLVGLVGAQSIPACGFALYVTPIVAAMPADELSIRSTTIGLTLDGYSSEGLASMFAAADQLRAAGYVVETVAGSTALAATLTVGEESPRFRLESAAGIVALDYISAVIDALEIQR
jgi:histidyl-tRNA synthetase